MVILFNNKVVLHKKVIVLYAYQKRKHEVIPYHKLLFIEPTLNSLDFLIKRLIIYDCLEIYIFITNAA